MVRRMYHECKLVHADLSEYNILYHIEETPASESEAGESQTEETTPKGHLYIIDVSQSVEHDHPHAFDFLRSDLKNVEEFFSKREVHCLTLRRSFEFITTPELPKASSEEREESVLRRWMQESEPRADGTEDGGKSDLAVDDDAVFMKSYSTLR